MIRLLPSFNCGVKYLLCEVDLFTKYTWIKPLRDKKATRVLQSLIETVNESNRKSNKIWVDQGGEFYNSFIQNWLEDNDILMYSTHNEGKVKPIKT